MHSPTLLIVSAILAALITTVLFAVWYFNKNIPGLGLWTLSFLCAAGGSASLLMRNHLHEVLSVVLAQGFLMMVAYTCLLGSRVYMRRPPWRHRYAVAAIAALLLLSTYFTAVQPRPDIRFVLVGVFVGLCFLFTACTLARGGFRHAPVRYLVAMAMGLHGVFALLRPFLFKLILPSEGPPPKNHLLELVPQLVMLEGTLALVLIGFGAVMLAHEYTTRELRHLAEVDVLTDVFNRRAFLTLLDKAVSGAQRSEKPLPVLLIDIDHFKKVNDTWGHHGGDDVLRHFVQLASRCLRKEDVMGRLGGEEFAIFLPHADAVAAAAVAERLRALVQAQPVQTADTSGHDIHITVSIGVALGAIGHSSDALLQRADEAMYLAKQRGRNRVEVLAGE